MIWPERPTCHDAECKDSKFLVWRPPAGQREENDPYHETYRTCGYCGSMHPEDLLKVIADGANVGGSDWKYGWPHKFYVHGIPNPIAGQPIPHLYAEKDGTVATYSAPSTIMAKWYNVHLLDQGYDEEAWVFLAMKLELTSGIKFLKEDGNLKYIAPYYGYQRT